MRRIAALIFLDFELLDLFGPMEMFGMLDRDFTLELVSETGGPVRSSAGLAAQSDRRIEDGVDHDILFVPGGPGTRREVGNTALLDWIAQASQRAELTLSVCTGSALLARAFVLDGRRATTNKAAFDWVAEQGHGVDWVRRARWVRDGAFYTSSGVSAGMDMALAVIADLRGREVADKVARDCEYTWHDDPDDDPFAMAHRSA